MINTEIYIDFEAISSPFNREFNSNDDWPFAYTIGIFTPKGFKTKTNVLDFKKLSKKYNNFILTKHIYTELGNILANDVKQLTKLNSINKNTVEFVAWSGELERRVISKVFDGVTVKDLNSDPHLSLKRITSEEISSINYFKNFRQDTLTGVSPRFYESRGLKDDGAIAALAGYILFMNQTGKEGKFKFSTDQTKLMNELLVYSKDDVVRMKIVKEKGADWIAKQSEDNKNRIGVIQKHSKIVSRNERLINDLKNYDEKLSVRQIIEILEKEKKEAQSKLDEVRLLK